MTEVIPHYALYGSSNSDAELESLHIETIAERGRTHEWEIEPHRHDNLLQVVWVERGQVSASLDGTCNECYGPAFILIPSSVVHGFSLETGTSGLVITIAMPFLQDILSETERAEMGPILSTPRVLKADYQHHASDRAIQAVRMLDEEYRWRRRARVTSISALCKTLLVQILRLIPEEQLLSVAQSDSQRRFEGFQQLLEHHYRDQWSVSRYAEAMGLSEKGLNRVCREVTDLTPLQLIHNRILNEAKRCLVYTAMSINEIAYELGYKDPTYFSRFFNRMAGQQASKFRRLHQAGLPSS